jgi:regulator of cell morphogenesis and NO signaling
MTTASMTLADLATSHSGASRVFIRHGLDYCCGGRRPLADICRERGIDADALIDEIRREDEVTGPAAGWDRQPLPAIVDHIVGYYHARLREEMPQLVAMAARVEERHAEKPLVPAGLAGELTAMHEGVVDHLAKEEQILFPLILAGHGTRAGGPIHVMELEHDEHRVHLERVKALTGNMQPPEYACTTWRALYLRLTALEADLMDHIHLENHILFPRALQGA